MTCKVLAPDLFCILLYYIVLTSSLMLFLFSFLLPFDVLLSPVWFGGHYNSLPVGRLQKAQNKAAKIILRCPIETSIEKRQKLLGWSYIKDTIDISTLNVFYNLQLTTRPKMIFERFQLVKDSHRVNTRAAKTTKYVLRKTKLVNTGDRMFHYRAVMLWNGLPDPTRILSKKGFKDKVKGFPFKGQSS